LAQQADNQGKTYNVMKNVSTHSMINANDGELDLRLELEDIGNNLQSFFNDISFNQKSHFLSKDSSNI